MGCCQSSTRRQASSNRHGDSSSRNHHQQTTSAGRRRPRTITTSGSNVAGSTPSPNDASPTSRRRRRDRPPPNSGGSEGLSQPLRRHVWTSKRPYTRAELDREREEFFDTRVTGRSETWYAIRMSIETMFEGDLATAQTILDAAGVVLPTGDLANGAYDEVGNFYQLPEYCVADPINLVVSTTITDDNHQQEASVAAGKDEDGDEALEGYHNLSDTDSQTSSQRRRRREEKGKGKAPDAATKITVRARLSDRGGPDLRVEMGRHQPVRVLIRRIQDELELGTIPTTTTLSGKGKENMESRRRPVRIAYLGKILRENESLVAQGWKEGHVVNALVFP